MGATSRLPLFFVFDVREGGQTLLFFFCSLFSFSQLKLKLERTHFFRTSGSFIKTTTNKTTMMTNSLALAANLLLLLWSGAPARVSSFTATSTPANSRASSPCQQPSTSLFAKRKGNKPLPKVVSQLEYIRVNQDGHDDLWKTMDIVEILNQGGVGILPTDTGYGLVTTVDSKAGLERILQIHKTADLELLCADQSTIGTFCYNINKRAFTTLKKNLPGPFTFVLLASTALPRIMFNRQKVGVRMPNDPVLRYFQGELFQGKPLIISSSFPLNFNEYDEEMSDHEQVLQCGLNPDSGWCRDIDFVVVCTTLLCWRLTCCFICWYTKKN
jgi:tRNA threonylcarbamoyl adenosine modification protein (Sua5/YciO/YrdC/YwlC family)